MQQSIEPVGACIIATRKYKGFVLPLLRSLNQFFLTDRTLKTFLFTDTLPAPPSPSTRLKIAAFKIESYGFPEATLFRYKTMTQFGPDIYQGCSHLIYLDADMRIVAPVGTEILNDQTAVLHPGFYNKETGSWGNRPESTSYTHPANRKQYFAGGVQGGKTLIYFETMKFLRDSIDEDETREIRAEWNDETHWNKYLADLLIADTSGIMHPVILDPSYCMVEEPEKRKEWGIDQLEPKIIALAKDHEAIRN